MSEKVRLTYEQLAYIVEKTGIEDPKKAVEYFAEIMAMESINPGKIQACVIKLMEKERKRIK